MYEAPLSPALAQNFGRMTAQPSLRAKRSNPSSRVRGSMDCFVAIAPRNDGAISGGSSAAPVSTAASSACP
ncbi:hypothetical protein CWO90_28350 [Bradyrhizobium sp. Leo121]|nr:hypothetical protein CWO90_28350 [Bradyrhizobium sp. Leo121]